MKYYILHIPTQQIVRYYTRSPLRFDCYFQLRNISMLNNAVAIHDEVYTILFKSNSEALTALRYITEQFSKTAIEEVMINDKYFKRAIPHYKMEEFEILELKH